MDLGEVRGVDVLGPAQHVGVNLSGPAGDGLGIEGGRFNNSEEIGWHFVVRNSLSLSALLLTSHDSTTRRTRLVEWAATGPVDGLYYYTE